MNKTADMQQWKGIAYQKETDVIEKELYTV